MNNAKHIWLYTLLISALGNTLYCDTFSVRIIELYNNYLSPAKADTCKMQPRCSEYAKDALSSNNFFIAAMMITDRLYRSDHDASRYQKIWVDGRLKLYDPMPGSDRDSARLVEDPIFSGRVPCHNPESCTEFLDDHPLDAASLFNFATRLQEVGLYDDAFWEYERLLIYYPHSRVSHCVQMNAFMCLYDDGEYLRAINYAAVVRRKILNDTNGAEFYAFWTAAAYARLKNDKRVFAELRSMNFSGEFADREPMLRAYTWAVRGDWATAQGIFSEVPASSVFKERAESAVKVCEGEERFTPKSPVLAGSLAMVPGLGYLYAGYPQSAISAAVLTGLFGWAAVQAAEDGNEPLAVAVGLIGMGWYMGNIYGSVNAAIMSNEEHNRRALLKLDLGFRF